MNITIPKNMIIDEGSDYVVFQPPKTERIVHYTKISPIKIIDVDTGSYQYIKTTSKGTNIYRGYEHVEFLDWLLYVKCVKSYIKNFFVSFNPLCLYNVEIDVLEGRISAGIKLRTKNQTSYHEGVFYQNRIFHWLFGCPESPDVYMWSKKKLDMIAKWMHEIYEKFSNTMIGKYILNSFKKLKYGVDVDISASWNYKVHDVPSLNAFMKNLIRYLTQGRLTTYNGIDVRARFKVGDRLKEAKFHVSTEVTLPVEGEVKIWK